MSEREREREGGRERERDRARTRTRATSDSGSERAREGERERERKSESTTPVLLKVLSSNPRKTVPTFVFSSPFSLEALAVGARILDLGCGV